MPTDDFRQERQSQKDNAQALFDRYRKNKLTLKRPVFFVPGWTDEAGRCWDPLRQVLGEILTNPKDAVFINFEQDAKDCSSFYDLGARLNEKVRRRIDARAKFDCVAHSMGGLDVRAAITDGDKPLVHGSTCITVATPHRGDHLGGLRNILGKIPLIST